MEGTSTMLRKAMSPVSLIVSLVCLAGPLSTPLKADTLLVDGVSAVNTSALPKRGLSKNQVAENFGEPLQRIAAVGEPPISRWEYQPFVVFFEYDRVVHAVARRP